MQRPHVCFLIRIYSIDIIVKAVKFKSLLALLFALLTVNAAADTLSVAVASNVQYVFDELKSEFKKESGHELQATFSSSGKLVAQIMHGAPFDVFISADIEYPAYLHRQGFSAAPPKVYAYGVLVLWSAQKRDLRHWQALLTSAGIKKIALANPKTAPYGREALNLLKFYRLDAQLESKLVFGESIAQTNQYIHSGVADLGFTAKAVVSFAQMQGQGSWIEMPAAAYQPMAQGALILKHGQQNNALLAQEFYTFLFSNKARMIFQRNGYRLP